MESLHYKVCVMSLKEVLQLRVFNPAETKEVFLEFNYWKSNAMT